MRSKDGSAGHSNLLPIASRATRGYPLAPGEVLGVVWEAYERARGRANPARTPEQIAAYCAIAALNAGRDEAKRLCRSAAPGRMLSDSCNPEQLEIVQDTRVPVPGNGELEGEDSGGGRLPKFKEKLTPREKSVLEMVTVQGLLLPVVAESLGISPGAVRTAVCRLRKKVIAP